MYYANEFQSILLYKKRITKQQQKQKYELFIFMESVCQSTSFPESNITNVLR